jgi:hypothetical protein
MLPAYAGSLSSPISLKSPSFAVKAEREDG